VVDSVIDKLAMVVVFVVELVVYKFVVVDKVY
jgi:hypothetical protein